MIYLVEKSYPGAAMLLASPHRPDGVVDSLLAIKSWWRRNVCRPGGIKEGRGQIFRV